MQDEPDDAAKIEYINRALARSEEEAKKSGETAGLDDLKEVA